MMLNKKYEEGYRQAIKDMKEFINHKRLKVAATTNSQALIK